MELDLDGLSGPVRQAVGGDEAAAGFCQRVVVPLRPGADVFGAGWLAEGVEDGLQRGGGVGGEVGVEPGVALEMRLQAQAPLGELVVAVVGVGLGAQGPDPLEREPDIGQAGAAGCGVGEDLVGARPGQPRVTGPSSRRWPGPTTVTAGPRPARRPRPGGRPAAASTRWRRRPRGW